MSIDVALVNLDRKEFLRPIDMGLASEIRAVEMVPTLFHVATLRLLDGPWRGHRVALINDASGPFGAQPPSWETVHGRLGGYRNILPEIVADLVEHRSEALDHIYGGTVKTLIGELERYVRDVHQEIAELETEVVDGDDTDGISSAMLPDAVADLARASALLNRLHEQQPSYKRFAGLGDP